MKIRKILFVTHFSELRFDALRSLLDLKQVGLDHVVLLNVIEREKVAMRRGTGYRKENEIRLREKANIRFIDWAETLFEKGMEVGVHIVVGDFSGQVKKAAVTEDVDLIIISPEKKGSMERLCSGSDLTEIIRGSAKPVLVYKHRAGEKVFPEKPFTNILLAIDWSSTTTKAVELIKSIGNIVKQVDVIYVASEKDLVGSSAMEIQKTRKQNRQKLELICHEIETAGISTRPHVYVGNIASEIHKAAKECESTMVMLGYPNKKNIWGRRLGGNIGRELAEKSIFPTILVPSGGS